MATITAKFLTKFDPADKSHVAWFKRMCDIGDQMGDPKSQITLVAEINLNPMKVELDHREALEWVHVHFCLGMKYARAVVNGQAWVPSLQQGASGPTAAAAVRL
jgi:hypothetical protein